MRVGGLKERSEDIAAVDIALPRTFGLQHGVFQHTAKRARLFGKKLAFMGNDRRFFAQKVVHIAL